jgi:hypothetical protein
MLLDTDWPNDAPPPNLAIDPVQWANLMTLARHANDQLVAASKRPYVGNTPTYGINGLAPPHGAGPER